VRVGTSGRNLGKRNLKHSAVAFVTFTETRQSTEDDLGHEQDLEAGSFTWNMQETNPIAGGNRTGLVMWIQSQKAQVSCQQRSPRLDLVELEVGEPSSEESF